MIYIYFFDFPISFLLKA